MTKSELILFKSKTKYFLDILYNERFNIYSEIRFGLFYNFRRYMDDRIHIVHQSKMFKDQFFKFNKERCDIFKRFNNEKLKLKKIAYTNILKNYLCFDIRKIIVDYII